MPDGNQVLFDRVGLCYIERYFWDEEEASKFGILLTSLLSPNAGRAWFRSPPDEGTEAKPVWTEANESTWETVEGLLESVISVWKRESEDSLSSYQTLYGNGQDGEGICAIFVDADRFRACVLDEDEDGSGLPEQFYVGFEFAWTWNTEGGGLVLTPHFRVSNQRPASATWAPPGSLQEKSKPISAEKSVDLLWSGFWINVETQFLLAKERLGIHHWPIDLGEGDQKPTVFFYATPSERLDDGESYLAGEYLRAMGIIGGRVLSTPDLRSIEISAGVMEGCISVFTHCSTLVSEKCLLVPMAGYGHDHIEEKIQFIVHNWNDIDFDATWRIRTIYKRLVADRRFYSLWHESLNSSMKLNESLFSLLGKDPDLKKETLRERLSIRRLWKAAIDWVSDLGNLVRSALRRLRKKEILGEQLLSRREEKPVQDRMFDLAQLLRGFLGKLHARTYSDALQRTQDQRSVAESIRASKRWAQRIFTVRKIPGLELPQNITEGYTRVFRVFEDKIGIDSAEAHELTLQIDSVGQSLKHTAGLEEERREKERQRARLREERNGKRLNMVLALVAVLAAVPLLVGQFDTSELGTVLSWVPFRLPITYWHWGLHFSFWIALVAFLATLFAIGRNLLSPREDPFAPAVSREIECSDAVFDCFRAYGHPRSENAIRLVERALARPEENPEMEEDSYWRRVWEEETEEEKRAIEEIDALDRNTARAVAEAMDQCQAWITDHQPPPENDAERALEMEKRVCRFVLLRDIFDLRPGSLHLPITLCLYRWRHDDAGLPQAPVSDTEFESVMGQYGFSEEILGTLEKQLGEFDARCTSAVEFVEACMTNGISVRTFWARDNLQEA